MRVNEIVQLELKALSKTICEYSTDNFIVSYAEQIKDVEYPEDLDTMTILIDRLIVWYEEEMQRIINDDYIHSKQSHIKSYNLLKELKKLIQTREE